MTPGLRRALAWGVHFYTALGLACAAGIAVLVVEGGPAAFPRAFLLMLLATLIDATDGTLARAVRVKEVLPGFDGRRLDDLIDFLTYVALPVLLVWRAGVLPAGSDAALLLPLFASAYGFCQVEAKTPDGYFLGFPSYWNIVAFYLVFLGMPPWLNLALIAGLSLLTFVPLRYLYPSMKGRLNFWTNLLAVPWVLLLLGALLAEPEDVRRLARTSLYYPAWYFAASAWVNLRRKQGGK
jgi:phosphatidylcholine synthase